MTPVPRSAAPARETPDPIAPYTVSALDRVGRAVAELRRGAPVVVAGPGDAVVCISAEGLDDAMMGRLSALAGSAPALLVTARRASVLRLAAPGSGPVRLILPGTPTAERLNRLADPESAAAMPTPPGTTVEPLPADSGAGASVTLAKLARLLPAVLAAPCPVPALEALDWAHAHDLVAIEAEAVLDHHEAWARALRPVGEARVPLDGAEETRVVAFRPVDGGIEHLAIVIGRPDPDTPVLARLHSECFTGDLLGSLRCDCGEQLRGALQAIAAEGAGVLLYLAQEGRGIGLVNKLRAYRLQDEGLDTVDANEQLGFDDDERIYSPAAEMLRHLGFQRVRLMTNNPRKISALARHRIEVTERVPHTFPANAHNVGYLRAKARRSGHLF
ncbi:GTP cyclohydrolase II [Roseospira marina]|uniref:GTP cyclohydrolase-2 n=1 Tax=Roseospira marina TaxID=140057 RepID=A0A5M6IDK0_9PROT|nr:GTP cyclohydrolase II [Roseospira marina]KAA5605839.1 GTP cyclohydrolase II [Roseospira marina]MBB4313658.1 GTP cyclohydrolase II [Roseospira marina]MBB5086820.1 GTP cyclohydrolase II [Roseospira marina]